MIPIRRDHFVIPVEGAFSVVNACPKGPDCSLLRLWVTPGADATSFTTHANDLAVDAAGRYGLRAGGNAVIHWELTGAEHVTEARLELYRRISACPYGPRHSMPGRWPGASGRSAGY
ncbi:MAG TPA: hypothetical protein VF541_01880 [Longimicrobium sp.]